MDPKLLSLVPSPGSYIEESEEEDIGHPSSVRVTAGQGNNELQFKPTPNPIGQNKSKQKKLQTDISEFGSSPGTKLLQRKPFQLQGKEENVSLLNSSGGLERESNTNPPEFNEALLRPSFNFRMKQLNLGPKRKRVKKKRKRSKKRKGEDTPFDISAIRADPRPYQVTATRQALNNYNTPDFKPFNVSVAPPENLELQSIEDRAEAIDLSDVKLYDTRTRRYNFTFNRKMTFNRMTFNRKNTINQTMQKTFESIKLPLSARYFNTGSNYVDPKPEQEKESLTHYLCTRLFCCALLLGVLAGFGVGIVFLVLTQQDNDGNDDDDDSSSSNRTLLVRRFLSFLD